METREFLDRVLPEAGGVFFGASVSPGDKFSQAKLESHDALEAYIASRKKQHHNVYYATGVYKSSREAEQTISKRCLYLDIDTGAGKPYVDKRAGLEALVAFCRATGFPPPNILVDSGGGLHPYWTFDRDIGKDQWQPMASALKRLCETHAFEVDPTITADSARILRVPGTVNFKDPDNPRPVKVLRSESFDYTVEALRDHLGTAHESVPDRLKQLAGADDLSSGTYAHDDRPRFARPILEQCGVFANTLATGGEGQPEQLWMRILHLMTYVTDGHEFIHALSNKHSGYDHQLTERKFASKQKAKDRGIGPTLCKTFELYMPDLCGVCPHKGTISTPLQLGIDFETEMPYGWRQDDKGIHKATVTLDDNGESTTEWIRVLKFNIENLQAFYNPALLGTHLTFDVTGNNVNQYVRITGTDLVDNRSIKTALAGFGIVLGDKAAPHMRQLLVDWYEQMRAARKVRRQAEQLGWTTVEKKPAFTLIDKVIKGDGSTREAAFIDRGLTEIYNPIGKKQVWLDLSRYITGQGRHAINATILSAFAAPLIKFTGVSSAAILTVVSEKSGTGKSTALKLAQAVWGDPIRGVHALSDTPLSVLKHLGFINTLPAYWDELRMREEIRQFVKLVFQVGQGKERSRLRSDTTMQRMGSWQTLMVAASNESITDQIHAMTSTTDAGLLRAFEIKVPPIKPDPNLKFQASKLEKNYGHIGTEYASYIVKNHDAIENAIQTVDLNVTKTLKLGSDERFRLSVVGSLIVASRIAKNLGFVNMDTAKFAQWLLDTYRDMRDDQSDAYMEIEVRAKHLILAFINSNWDQFVSCDELSNQSNKGNVGAVYSQPMKGEVVGVLSKAPHAVRIGLKFFRKWLRETHPSESPSWITKELLKRGAIKGRCSVAAGVGRGVSQRIECLDINLESEEFADLLECLPEQETDLG